MYAWTDKLPRCTRLIFSAPDVALPPPAPPLPADWTMPANSNETDTSCADGLMKVTVVPSSVLLLLLLELLLLEPLALLTPTTFLLPALQAA